MPPQRRKRAKAAGHDDPAEGAAAAALCFKVMSPVSSRDLHGHDTRLEDDSPHQESARRVTHILDALRKAMPNVLIDSREPHAKAVFQSALHAIHDEAFLSKLKHICDSLGEAGSCALTPRLLNQSRKTVGDSRVSESSLETALSSLWAVLTAVDFVGSRAEARVFCAIRPPGHHACPNGPDDKVDGCGFCLLSNVAVAAYYALRLAPIRHERVAIVDLDVHHGNGTEACVRDRIGSDSVLYASLHLREAFTDSTLDFFPGTGEEHIQNEPSKPWIVNLPLSPLWPEDESTASAKLERIPHQGRLSWRARFENELLPVLDKFKPTLILISTGFDGGLGDEGNVSVDGAHAGLDLLPDDFAWSTKLLVDRGVPVVSVLEGGYGRFDEEQGCYDYAAYEACVLAHITSLYATPPPPLKSALPRGDA